MIEVKQASQLGGGTRKKISEIFVEAFGEHFTYFSKDSQTLRDALEHIFILDVFYVAIIEGEIAGMIACTDGKISSVKSNRKELIKHLGFLKGIIASIVFKSYFEKQAIEIGDKKASVEFVATSSKFRGRGVATTIMNHLFTLPQYNEYILEAADTNTNAMKLYEKLGYKEFKSIKQKHSQKSGINYLVYLKYKQDN